jgi:hypothetical protein
MEKSLQKSSKAKAAKEALPVPSKAPLTATGRERLVATIQKQRVVCKQMEERIGQLEKEIEMIVLLSTSRWRKICCWKYLPITLEKYHHI